MSPNRILQVAFIFFAAFLLSEISFAAADEPDLRREKRFHDIYQRYNATPTREESWTGAVSGKSQAYRIQEGDTLWDLSSTLFGDSQFWPKVWSLNSTKIENPHSIYPGLSVYFTPGTTGEAPALAVNETNEDATETEAAPPAEAQTQAEILARSELPPEIPSPPPGKIPGSLPPWAFTRQKSDVDVEIQIPKRNFPIPQETLSYYASDRKIEPIGTVTETELSLASASDFQFIYVNLPQGVSDPNLLVVKDIGELKDPYSKVSGNLIQVQGEISILEKVNSGENLYRAMVKKAINPIEVGAFLTAGTIPSYNIKEEGIGSASAHVVGGPHGTDRVFLDSRSIVFLSGQGLTPGRTYPIFKYQSLRNEKTKSIESPRQIGRVKVIQVADRFATGVILIADEEIRIGDVTSPQLISK